MSVMRGYKGMRAFSPEEHVLLEQVLSGWTSAATSYGFSQYKTSLLDLQDLYEGKTSEEIMQQQTYAFVDRGKRSVVLRPEITPGVSAMVVSMQKGRSLHLPFRGFSIGSVFRYERTQKGRSREHIQFNADIFGEPSLWADAEVIELAFTALEMIGFSRDDFVVHVNDRSSMRSALLQLGASEDSLDPLFRLLDRREKLDADVFEKRLKKLTSIPLDVLDGKLRETPLSVQNLLHLLPRDIPAEYSPRVVRGFDYYTGIVFELFSKDSEVSSRSVAGGGRYDTLIESYGGDPLPAVGFGMGDVVLLDCLAALQVATPARPLSAVVCTTTESVTEAYKVGRDIREHIPTSFIGSVSGKKLGGMYKRYERTGVRYVIDVRGSRDFTVRDLSLRETAPYHNVRAIVRDIQAAGTVPLPKGSDSGTSFLSSLKRLLGTIKNTP